MGEIYKGSGFNKNHIGECKDGIIYSGHGIGKEFIGTYGNNCIYDKYKNMVGTYSNGQIFSGSGFGASQVGEYNGGAIYRGCGMGKSLVGEYSDEPAGAAAYLLLSFPSASANTQTSPHSSLNINCTTQETRSQKHGKNTFAGSTIFVYLYLACISYCFVKSSEIYYFLNKYDLPIVFLASLIIFFIQWKMHIKKNYSILPVAIIYSLITILYYILYKFIFNYFFNDINLVLDENYMLLLLYAIIYSVPIALMAFIVDFLANTDVSILICMYNCRTIIAFLLFKGFLNEISLIKTTELNFFEAIIVKPFVFVITLAYYILCYLAVVYLTKIDD